MASCIVQDKQGQVREKKNHKNINQAFFSKVNSLSHKNNTFDNFITLLFVHNSQQYP
jgi:hypothetical protein